MPVLANVADCCSTEIEFASPAPVAETVVFVQIEKEFNLVIGKDRVLVVLPYPATLFVYPNELCHRASMGT